MELLHKGPRSRGQYSTRPEGLSAVLTSRQGPRAISSIQSLHGTITVLLFTTINSYILALEMATNYDDFDDLFGDNAKAVLHELTSWSNSDHEEKMVLEMSLEEPPSKRTRFAFPKSSPEREKAACGVIPRNTKSSTQWALKILILGLRIVLLWVRPLLYQQTCSGATIQRWFVSIFVFM